MGGFETTISSGDLVPEAPGHGASFFWGRKMTDCDSSNAFWQEIARFLRVQTESSGHADTTRWRQVSEGVASGRDQIPRKGG